MDVNQFVASLNVNAPQEKIVFRHPQKQDRTDYVVPICFNITSMKCEIMVIDPAVASQKKISDLLNDMQNASQNASQNIGGGNVSGYDVEILYPEHNFLSRWNVITFNHISGQRMEINVR